ncbi:hypothetical protein JCM10213_002087 [Rhodosporidiobolus nylandii]
MNADSRLPEDPATSLHALLDLIDRCRSSLPATVAASLAAVASPADRAQQYRTTSNECWATIRSLGEQFDALEPVLSAAEASGALSPNGVVVLPRERKAGNAWEQLGAVLGGSEGGRGGAGSKGKAKEPFKRQFEPPTSPEELADFVQKWEATRPRVRLKLVGTGSEAEPREMRVTLRGVMRATVVLRWQEGADGRRAIGVDLVNCCGLSESKPPYLPSQFSLFQTLTNSAMLLVDRARIRRARADGECESIVEEVLTFLSDPPLPFQ